jgi:hypothetical protein
MKQDEPQQARLLCLFSDRLQLKSSRSHLHCRWNCLSSELHWLSWVGVLWCCWVRRSIVICDKAKANNPCSFNSTLTRAMSETTVVSENINPHYLSSRHAAQSANRKPRKSTQNCVITVPTGDIIRKNLMISPISQISRDNLLR